MKNRKLKKSKKIKNLVSICALCAILLSVSTYAWFIGMKTVNVTEFDINIATTEGLFLSMDGSDWRYTLDAKNTPAYTNNANQWLDGPNEGLIPMSSIGEMDEASSRMKLYEKGSLTAVTGGYRLLASRVDNNVTKNAGGIEYEEGNGYIAFDLFVKNLSGEAYYPEDNVLNEEAIYLNTNSAVTVALDGEGNAGIENSVRVGFVQLGRVSAALDTDDEDIQNLVTSMTCADSEDDVNNPQHVTGICRNAAIWEPNDTKHVQNALNWYNESCLERTGADVNAAGSYSEGTQCATLNTITAYPTYAISREIVIADNVNVYDGLAYNKYAANTKTLVEYNAASAGVGGKADMKLIDMTYDATTRTGYFTDTMKNIAGKDRPQFMTLAPNSITKLRVYIWIEGQDIDNYDFASLGKKITINFGFTKERYNQSDFPDYDGPDVPTTNE